MKLIILILFGYFHISTTMAEEATVVPSYSHNPLDWIAGGKVKIYTLAGKPGDQEHYGITQLDSVLPLGNIVFDKDLLLDVGQCTYLSNGKSSGTKEWQSHGTEALKWLSQLSPKSIVTSKDGWQKSLTENFQPFGQLSRNSLGPADGPPAAKKDKSYPVTYNGREGLSAYILEDENPPHNRVLRVTGFIQGENKASLTIDFVGPLKRNATATEKDVRALLKQGLEATGIAHFVENPKERPNKPMPDHG